MLETRQFHIGDILSITTGKLLSPRHVDGLYDILNFMTRDNLFTHQLGRASDECKPHLLRQHPQFADVTGEDITTENWREWLARMVERFGEQLPVTQIPQDDHERKNPLDELIAMRGTDEGIITVQP